MSVRADERALVWDVPPGWHALSSASVGGGLIRPSWVCNLGVDNDFARTDLEAYAAERAAGLGLSGPGTTLLTAVDVTQVQHGQCEGVHAWATVGVTRPTWALAPAAAAVSAPTPAHGHPPRPGTINLVVSLPVALTGSALVQSIGTLTEAKAQALIQAGIPGTGTASDAAVVLCPADPADAYPAAHPATGAHEPFAGVRSLWGQRLAVAVHMALSAGLSIHPWSPSEGATAVTW